MLAVHPQSVLLHRRESHHTGIFTLVVRAVIRFLCSLRGHELVWHFEPDRLSLGCLKCGMNTPGWTIDVNPALRRRAPAAAQVLPNRTRDKAA